MPSDVGKGMSAFASMMDVVPSALESATVSVQFLGKVSLKVSGNSSLT
jgi:hypothetical protein